MLLKQYTTVWTRTGRKMGWVLVYVVKMSFVLWHFDTLTQIERSRLHNTSEISAVSFTYEFMGLWKPLTLLLIHPIWWTRLVLCVYCIYTHTQNHSRWSFTVDFRGGFEPITPIMINICFFFCAWCMMHTFLSALIAGDACMTTQPRQVFVLLPNTGSSCASKIS